MQFRLLRAAKLIGPTVALAMMLCAIWVGAQQTGLQVMFGRPWPLLAGIGLYALYCILNANAWLLVLKSLGYLIPAATGIPLWIRCESFRWLPGNVWNFGARSVETAQLGVPSSVGAVSMTCELGFSVISRLILAGYGGMLLADRLHTVLTQWSSHAGLVGLGCGVALLTLAIMVVVRNKNRAVKAHWDNLTSIAKSVLDGERWKQNFRLLLYYVGIGCLHGLALKCLVVSLTGNHEVPLVGLISANAAAWLVGFFAIFAPGGLIVREAALATALSAWFSPTECLSIAISWRVVQTIVEFLLLACVLWQTNRRPHVARQEPRHVLFSLRPRRPGRPVS